MTKVINLWSGPGAGKSTIAADLFAEMKWEGHNVELINETAKSVTWEGHHNLLQDQLYISALQNRKQLPLVGQVDWIITDSPLLISLAYVPNSYLPSFKKMMIEAWNTYDNINYFINRKKKYMPVGRSQTEEQAQEVDLKLKKIMHDLEIHYGSVDGTRQAKTLIMKDLG